MLFRARCLLDLWHSAGDSSHLWGWTLINLAFPKETLSSCVGILTEEITKLPAGSFHTHLVFKALSAGLKLKNDIKMLNQLGAICCCLQIEILYEKSAKVRGRGEDAVKRPILSKPSSTWTQTVHRLHPWGLFQPGFHHRIDVDTLAHLPSHSGFMFQWVHNSLADYTALTANLVLPGTGISVPGFNGQTTHHKGSSPGHARCV